MKFVRFFFFEIWPNSVMQNHFGIFRMVGTYFAAVVRTASGEKKKDGSLPVLLNDLRSILV